MVKVECDGCKAPYQIDERRIPPTGLKMRCPKCGTNLLVQKPAGGGDSDLPALPEKQAKGPPGAPPAARPPGPPRPPPKAPQQQQAGDDLFDGEDPPKTKQGGFGDRPPPARPPPGKPS